MNEETITINKLEYDKMLKTRENLKELEETDFLILINNGKILPALHPNFNENRMYLKIKSNDYTININGKKYDITNAGQFYRLKNLMIDNLQSLINYSIQENKIFNKYNYSNQIKKELIFKFGKLIIKIDGNVDGEIGVFYDKLMDEITKLVTLPLKEYIETNLNDSGSNNNVTFNDACKIAMQEIQNGRLKGQYKFGFKGIKDFGKSWCFIPEFVGQNDDTPSIRNLLVLIVSKSTLKFEWVDHMHIIKDFRNASNVDIPSEYQIND